MEEIVYLNDSLVSRDEAKISVSDHGLLYGYGLFETMRAYNGNIFLLDRHINRLRSSAEIIGLGTALQKIDVAQACMETLKANNLSDARLRLTVTGGGNNDLVYPIGLRERDDLHDEGASGELEIHTYTILE